MKLLVSVLLVALVALASGKKGKGRVPGLKHFNMGALNADFKKFMVPDDSLGGEECEAEEVKKCIRCVHSHAMVCVLKMKMNPAHMAEVAACEAADEEWKAKDAAWQRTSGQWHKAVQDCLAADRPDAPPAPEDSLFMLRKKRSPFFAHDGEGHSHDGHGHGHHHGHGCGTPKYGDSKADILKCWKDMREHKEMCNEKVLGCPKLALCMGYGEEPTTSDADKAWFAYMKTLRDDKAEKVRAHKANMMECATGGEE